MALAIKCVVYLVGAFSLTVTLGLAGVLLWKGATRGRS